ncbi:MAG: lytic murein transglycosylase [Rhodospirillaceae bacterium]|nr:lytic murein transglycosylase [Rhodospirillaceae bacterium]
MRKKFLLALLPLLGAAPAAGAGFSACVEDLKKSAVRAGVDRALAARALAIERPDEMVLRLSQAAPEFKTPIWDYFAFLVDEARIADGRAMMAKYAHVLAAIERRYGVDRHIVVAIWGVETDYGREPGTTFLPHAFATLACAQNARTRFWRGELMAALALVDKGDLAMNELYGSWAGAFGQTQFMPTTYRRLAVDFDGDGRRDLVRSVPDALASAANFLRRAGWKSGESWMIEVRVPKGYAGPAGRRARASLSAWSRKGVARADGRPLAGAAQAGLLLPAGAEGPGFLVFANFEALYAYNHAESYALAVSHLADRLAGYPGLRGKWPTDDPGLSRVQRLHLQKLLIVNGFMEGEADGKIGPVTRAGIEKAETSFGMKPTGRAGWKIYRALGGG